MPAKFRECKNCTNKYGELCGSCDSGEFFDDDGTSESVQFEDENKAFYAEEPSDDE